ncbi:MAG: hypothetical protein MHMPM18_000501 [Marteilia pararefringens]
MTEPEGSEQFATIPLDQRLSHSNWRCRESAYDDLQSKIDSGSLDSDNIEIIENNVKLFVDEKIAPALEKSSKVILDVLEHLSFDNDLVASLSSSIVKKLFGNKPKIKDNAYEILLKLIQTDYNQPIFEVMLNEGIKNSNVKISIASIDFIKLSIESFGSKILTLQDCIKPLIALTEHRDTNVRSSTKNLIATLMHIYGENCRVLFSSIKPVVLKEINGKFEEIKSNPKKPAKAPLSSKNNASVTTNNNCDSEINQSDEVNSQSGTEEPVFDPYDHSEEIQLQSLVSKSFNASLNDKSWKVRKEALDDLKVKLDTVLRMKHDSQMQETIDQLKTIIAKDSNIAVVSSAAQILSKFLQCLRSSFTGQFDLIKPLQTKLKERKVTISGPVTSCLVEAFNFCADKGGFLKNSLEDAQSNANPILKTSVLNFHCQILKSRAENLCDASFIQNNCTILIKLVGDSSQEVRDSAMIYLGLMVKLNSTVQEKIKSLPDAKKAKITEYAESLEISAKPTQTNAAKQHLISLKYGKVSKFKAVRPDTVKKDENTTHSNTSNKENLPRSKSSKTTVGMDSIHGRTYDKCEGEVEFIFDDPALLNKLDSKTLDIRFKALESLYELLKPHQSICGQLCQLFDVLLRRLSESNKNMMTLSLKVFALILSCHSKPQSFIPQLFIPIAHSLSESKSNIRQLSLQVLDLLAKNHLDSIKFESFTKILKSDNKYQINDFIEWLLSVWTNNKHFVQHTDFCRILTLILNLLNHKNADIRAKSSEVIQNLASFISKDIFLKAIGDLKSKEKSRNLIDQFFENQNRKINANSESDASLQSADTERVSMVSRSTKASTSIFQKTNSMQFSRNTKNNLRDELSQFLPIEIVDSLCSTDLVEIQQVLDTLIQAMEYQDEPDMCALVLSNSDAFLMYLIRLFQKNDDEFIAFLQGALQNFLNVLISNNLQLADNSATALIKLIIRFMSKQDSEITRFAKDILSIVYDLTRRSLIIKELLNTLSSTNDSLKCDCLEDIIHMIENYPYDFNEMLHLNCFIYRQMKHTLMSNCQSLRTLMLQCLSLIVKNVGSDFLKKLSLTIEQESIFTEYYDQFINSGNDRTQLAKSISSISVMYQQQQQLGNSPTLLEQDIGTNELLYQDRKPSDRISTPKSLNPYVSNGNLAMSHRNDAQLLQEITMNVPGGDPNHSMVMLMTDEQREYRNLQFDINSASNLLSSKIDYTKTLGNLVKRVTSPSSPLFKDFSTNIQDGGSDSLDSHTLTILQVLLMFNNERLNEIEACFFSSNLAEKLNILRTLMISAPILLKYFVTILNSEQFSQTVVDSDSTIDLIVAFLDIIPRLIANDPKICNSLSTCILTYYTQQLVIISSSFYRLSFRNSITNENSPQIIGQLAGDFSNSLYRIVNSHYKDLSSKLTCYPNQFLIPSLNCITLTLSLEYIDEGIDSLFSIVRNNIIECNKSLEDPDQKLVYLPSILIALNQFYMLYKKLTPALNQNYLAKASTHSSKQSPSKSQRKSYITMATKIVNSLLLQLTQLYGTYLDTQLKQCPPELVQVVFKQYLKCVERIMIKSGKHSGKLSRNTSFANFNRSHNDSMIEQHKMNNSGFTDVSFDATLNNSLSRTDNFGNDSRLNSSVHSSDKIKIFTENQTLAELKSLLKQPESIYVAIRNLWIYLNETNQKFKLNEIIKDLSPNLHTVVSAIYDLYEVISPKEDSECFSIESISSFNNVIQCKFMEQLGIIY